MKYLFSFALTLLLFTLNAQKEYTIAVSSGKLKISEVNMVTIEGYDGPNVVVEIEDYNDEVDERAQGLKLISPSGLIDNTGIGLYVGKEEGETVVKAISLRSDSRYIFKVPKSVSLYYEHSTHEGGDLIVKDFAGELEVSARFNSVHLENVTGPLAVNSVHGNVEAKFNSINQTNSISLVSMHGFVDVTVPAQSKANFHLSSDWGEMFSDLDLKVDGAEEMKSLSNRKIDAQYNGGGVDFTIKSNHADIYLRKK